MGDSNEPISLKEYARHRKAKGLRGGSTSAVTRAVASGRLVASVVTVSGRPKIRSKAEADAEWAANTRVEAGGIAAPAPLPASHDPIAADGLPDGMPGKDEVDLNEARRRHEIERWRRAEVERKMAALELAKAEGELVSAADAERVMVEEYTRVRNKLLGVPSRCKQAMPEIPIEVVNLIDDRIREALEELSGER